MSWALWTAAATTMDPPQVRAAPGDAPAAAGAVPASTSPIDRAAELLTAAQGAADADARRNSLDEARRLLTEFKATQASVDETARAETWLGALLSYDGTIAAAATEQVADPAQRAARLEAARQLIRQGDQELSVAIDRLGALIEAIPTFLEPTHPDFARRERYKETYIRARLHHAAAVEALAATYPAEGDEAKELNRAAADRYDSIYRDYRTLIVGLVARLKQGECYRNLGDTKRALGLYNDILSQPPELEPLRRLRLKAMQLSLECWTMPSESLYELAFSQGEEYLTGVRPEETLWPEWQAIRYYTARGYLQAAAALPADRAAERIEWLGHAREKAAAAAATEGPYRDAAQRLAQDIGRATGGAN